MRSLHTTLPRLWLQRGPKVWPLLPLAWLYGALVGLRRLAFARGWLASGHPGVPVHTGPSAIAAPRSPLGVQPEGDGMHRIPLARRDPRTGAARTWVRLRA